MPEDMKCADLMQRDIQWIKPNEPVLRAARLMRDGKVGFLPVCDEHGRALGVITDRDIALRLVAEELSARDTEVTQVMTQGAITCHGDDDVRTAEDLMGRLGKSRMLVVNERHTLIGVISLDDIIKREPRRRAVRTAQRVTARRLRR